MDMNKIKIDVITVFKGRASTRCTKMHNKFSTMIYVNSITREIKVYVGKDTYCKWQHVTVRNLLNWVQTVHQTLNV